MVNHFILFFLYHSLNLTLFKQCHVRPIHYLLLASEHSAKICACMCSCKELFYPLTSDSNNQSLSVYVLYHRLRTHDNYIPNSLHPKTISQSQIENFVKCMKTLAVCRKIGQNIVGIRGIFGTTTDYRHPERAFFSKIRIWLGQTNLAEIL